MGAGQQNPTARRARTTTRIVVGATLHGLEKAGELLDVVANRAELAALPPGSVPGHVTTPPALEPALPSSGAVAAHDAGTAPEHLGTGGLLSRRGAIALGAVFELEDRALAITERTARTGTTLVDLGWRAGRAVAPGSLRRRVAAGLEGLADRGRTEESLSREESADAVNQLVEQGTGGPWLVETMNVAVGRLLGPMLDNVLPLVVERLRENPEPIKELVRDQSVTMAGEVATTVRSGASAADSSLERIARRLTLRRPRADLPPAPSTQ